MDDNAPRSTGQEQGQSQEPAGGQTGMLWQSINMQIAALVIMIIATTLSVIVLQGVKDQQEGLFPCKDYSFIDRLPRISTALTALVALYFLYLAWMDHRQNPDSKTLSWLFIANAFAVGASAIKLDVLYTAEEEGEETDEIIEDAVG